MKDAVEVAILKADEPWSELQLQDGSVLRYKSAAAAVFRLDGQVDVEGNPVYVIKSAKAVHLVERKTGEP